MKLFLLYCYFWKCLDLAIEAESLKKKLEESEEENAKLKEMVAQKDK